MDKPRSGPMWSMADDGTRLAALNRTLLLDSPTDVAFDRLTRLAARLLRVPVAVVSLVDNERQFFKSAMGLPEPWASRRETPLSHSFCRHVVASGDALIVADARQDPLLRDNPAILDLQVVAYAGIPLITADGQGIGSFCAIDSRTREWTADEVAVLRELAAATMVEIELHATTLEARRRADEAERERHEKTTILESITDAFFALDHAWRFTYVNAEAERVLQRPRATLLGQSLWTAFPGAIGSVFEHEYRRAVAEQVTVSFEAPYPPLNTWIDVRVNPTAGGLSVYFRDIGARRRMEAELRASKEQLTRIVETVADGIAIVDLSGHIVFANTAAERILGLTRANLAARTYDDAAWELATPDGQPFPHDELPPAHVMRTGQAVFDVAFAIVRPDGTQTTLAANAAPLRNADGALEGVVVSFTDRTAQARVEAAQRFLLDASGVLVSSLDYQGMIDEIVRLAIPRLADWCTVHIITDGTLTRPAVAHRDPEREHLIHEAQRQHRLLLEFEHPLADVLRTGQPFLVSRIDDALLDRWIHDPALVDLLRTLGLGSTMIVPLVARGQILGALSFMSGESGRHYDDDDLQLATVLAQRCGLAIDNARLYQDAQRTLQEREDFLSMVSHDLKQPLGVITAYAQLAQRRLRGFDPRTGARVSDSLSKIEGAAANMTQSIDDLLDAARLHAGEQLDLRLGPTDLIELVQRAVADQQQTTERHHLRLSTTRTALIGTYDAARLERVLANLLSNAIKYSPAGGEVVVAVRETIDHDGRWNVVEVRDHGVGIPAEDLPFVFERFRRGANVKGQIGGNGIGLASARQIVEQHFGSIAVDSPDGSGTTVTIRLPADDAPLP